MIVQNSDFEFYQAVGNNIKRYRTEQGVEQDTLATMLALTRASIINIEKGRQRPSLFQVCVIAQFLQISPMDILPVSKDSVPHDELVLKIRTNPDLADEKDQQTISNFVSSIHVSAIKKPF
jgi:DNA-binding XRE family transcriptional regulator